MPKRHERTSMAAADTYCVDCIILGSTVSDMREELAEVRLQLEELLRASTASRQVLRDEVDTIKDDLTELFECTTTRSGMQSR